MTTFTEKFTEAERTAFVECALQLGNISEARRRAAAGAIPGLTGPMEISQGYAHELVKRRREAEEDAAMARMSAPEIARRIIDREMARMAEASEAGSLDFIQARAMAKALAELEKIAGRSLVAPPAPTTPSGIDEPSPESILERLTREATAERDALDAAERADDDDNEDVIYDDDPRLLGGDDAPTVRELNLVALRNET